MKKKIEKKQLSKVFNLNSILYSLVNFIAYIVALISAGLILYLSFVESFDFDINWTRLSIFTAAVVSLAWLNWNSFYRKRYEKVMSDDIEAGDNGQYSVHSRYYFAAKDWKDDELQEKIDEFNAEYTSNWLKDVEATTGTPINTTTKILIDEISRKPVLDENGKPKIVEVKGIKDRRYHGFHHKILMWRVKHHIYPKTGYKTSMELLSQLSFQESNLDKRDLKAAKHFYIRKSASKLISLILVVSLGASLVPQFLKGEYAQAIINAIIGFGSLISSIAMGSINGIRGARLKLSSVEDVACDLEKWANKKPILVRYAEPKEEKVEELKLEVTEKPDIPNVTEDIFKSTSEGMFK